MSGEVVISLLFFTASLPPLQLVAGEAPVAPTVPWLVCRWALCSGAASAASHLALEGGLGWAPGWSDRQAQEGGPGKGAASGIR